MFNGFSDDTVRFFLDLKFHNESVFFHENHQRYIEYVQKPFYELINDLAPYMLKIDPLMEIRPNKCLAHIHRDTRFTKDKSPYRDHLWLLFRRQAEPREKALNYFFEFGLDTIGWGMGFWGENREALDLFRKQIVAYPDEISGMITDINMIKRSLVLEGTVHKRIDIPPGVNESLKRWYCTKEMYICKDNPPYRSAFSDKLINELRSDFQALAPLYRKLRGYCDELD